MTKELTKWIKADGKAEIMLNDLPATVELAKILGWKREDDTAILDDLRAEYEAITGNKPHPRMGAVRMREAIVETVKTQEAINEAAK